MYGESGASGAGSVLGEVRSADGTAIGYQRTGTGPAVVLLHGAGQSSGNLMRLARAISGAFTVYVPDRRGRGRSGPYGEFHGLSTEIEDLSALLAACGASRVFGLSAGAVIAIEAALVRPDITKLALYEPPLSFDGVVHGDWAPQYERLLTAGQPGAALVTVLKATADRTSPIRWLPRRPLGAALDFAIKRTGNRPAPEGVMSPRELIPTVRYDAQTVHDAAGALERFQALSCEVLLLGGSRSSRDLAASLEGLSRVLPGARRVVLHGTGHTAPDNSKQPDRVAAELRRFFSG
ncbi:MAG TPA: alpha/beta hydrolase [Streptosporangiaceae bacterium]|nr:alpha/beta hydrolase [Streptosporangiaceae bacterium]